MKIFRIVLFMFLVLLMGNFIIGAICNWLGLSWWIQLGVAGVLGWYVGKWTALLIYKKGRDAKHRRK